ncbi:DUF6531 domain-containing protein [Niabella aurantiaca]|uniref:DUF6531 domain-containing protein n=1 Tax=Niabella aurantiaca TaxID=379900 RepID=UPI00035DAD17|nr:DUF6531 domain-containing protein [Niabella aurantiaca]
MSSANTAASKSFGETFAEVKGGIDNIQKSMASVLPSFPGVSGGKYLDMAIGLDFDQTILPPCPVFPVPHIGLVFDIFAAIMNAVASALPAPPPSITEGEDGGSPSVASVASFLVNMLKPSVKVHGQWASNAGTPIMHLPGIVLHLIPLTKPFTTSEMWMGSSTVLADGGPYATQFHPSLSCNLVGFPSLPRKNKIPRLKFPLMLPTSILLCIFAGNGRVLAGGPPTIDLFQLMIKLGLKGLSKARKKKTKAPDTKSPELGHAQPAKKCDGVSEPVDMATGKVYHTNTDFELPGPIPLQWNRTYYSNAEVAGPLGYNWHHSYNMGLYDMDNGYFTLRLSDGREVALPKIHPGEVHFNRKEQLFFQNDKEGWFVTDAGQRQYRFNGPVNADGFHTLSSVSDPSGFSISFLYDLKGCLKRIIDSRNQVLQVENDALGHITRIFTIVDDREISFIRYEYDAAGNIAGTFDATGAEKHFYYEGHLLVKLTNQNGMSFYWEYEGKGNDAKCIHVWGDEGVLEYWTEYQEGISITRNSLGYTSTYYHDNRFLNYKIVDENGGITRRSYNEYEEPEVVVNPEGGAAQYRYNKYGKPLRIVNENGNDTSFSYDDQQRLKSVVTPGGSSRIFTYDEKGRITSSRNADGLTIEYEYEGLYLRRIIDPKKRPVTLSYDQQHNLTAIHYANGLKQQWSYDALGYVTRHTDIRGNTTEYRNDDGGNVLYIKEPDGNEHHFSYDTSGNLIHARDRTRQVHFEYGPLGVLRKHIQNNRTIQFNYDTELQLKSIANEGGELYKFGLDGLGNVVNEWGFDGLHRRYLRDANGRVTRVLRPEERWTSYDYDSAGNIVKEEHSDGTMAAYKYNPDGLLVEAFNEHSHIQLQHDRAGRVIKETQGGYSVTKKYDRYGNCIHTGSSLGADIRTEYDEEDWIARISATSRPHQGPDADSDGTPGWAATFHRDSSGLELHRELSSQVSVKTERDRLGRVTRRSIGAQNVEQSRTRYDWGTGNKLNRMVNELSRTNSLFDYDAFDNLISATYEDKDGTTETIYRIPDKIGNLFRTRDRSDRKYSKGGRLQEDGRYTYHYDGEGNLIFKEFKHNENPSATVHTAYAKEQGISLKHSGTGWIYEWAGNGTLRKVINPGGLEIEFYYDPLGRRIAKMLPDKNARFFEEDRSTVTRWVWDGNVPLHEWSYRGAYPPKRSIDADGTISEEKEPVENLVTWVYEEGMFVPSAKIMEEESYTLLSDYIGRPTHCYDNKGNIVWQYEYDIYGSPVKLKGKKNFIPFRQLGQYEDEELEGLYYNRFRYYDSSGGGYISQDPVGLMAGLKLYSYVKNPANYVDTLGLHEAIGILNGKPVLTKNGSYSWISTPGSSKAPFNGYGAAGHSEAKMLERLETTLGKKGLQGGHLEIISMGQMTKGGKSTLSTLPPCPRCMQGLEAFATRNEINITYKWEGGEQKFQGH